MDRKDKVMEFIAMFEGLRRYRRWFRDHSIPVRKNEMMLLMYLVHNLPSDSVGMQPSELGERLRLTRPTITTMVNGLEGKGYVVRLNDEEDRRVVYVRPTESGMELVREAQANFATNIGDLIDYLGEGDSQELLRIMKRVRQFMDSRKTNEARGTDECGD
ncbi:MAG: MarR family transcriptional regulator [Firmicutes bacterium]|jgi:DNA-binding MarR family transcriptional regulator|nr:MarR family transcriptional regulator [Bacillota bacterium]NLO65733.1 MarR family transcriptional regulator [Bacillota bacterium]